MSVQHLQYGVIGTLLLTLELYHVVSHCYVMFGIRMLPRKDLVRVRAYFLVDTMTVVFTTIFAAPHLWWLTAPQVVQHLYYFIWWERSGPARKIVTWSSAESRSLVNGGRRFSPFLWDLGLGTAFDIAVHLTFAWALVAQIPPPCTLMAMVMCGLLVRLILHRRNYAWVSANADVPAWIKKRLDPSVTY